MRDYRGIWKINWARQSGIKISQFFNFMNEHYEGGGDKVSFTKMDCYNEIGRERTILISQ
jgi:hypothetical protein